MARMATTQGSSTNQPPPLAGYNLFEQDAALGEGVRREEQERELIDAAAAETARVLGPWRDQVEHVALGGDRSAVGRVLESRADLVWLQPLALERFFDVVEPRLRVLEALPYQLYAAKVVEEG